MKNADRATMLFHGRDLDFNLTLSGISVSGAASTPQELQSFIAKLGKVLIVMQKMMAGDSSAALPAERPADLHARLHRLRLPSQRGGASVLRKRLAKAMAMEPRLAANALQSGAKGEE